MNPSDPKKYSAFRRRWLAPLVLVPLTGCQGAPSINLLGSYFPGWMLSMGVGMAAAMGIRQLFLRLGIEAHIGPRPFIYFCLWLLITLSVWLLFFRS